VSHFVLSARHCHFNLLRSIDIAGVPEVANSEPGVSSHNLRTRFQSFVASPGLLFVVDFNLRR
jgi:hypothetical protein